MDRISGLPNELLCHIASFLSAKEAAFAMVLSKRWRHLFTIIPELEFEDDYKSSDAVSDEDSDEERDRERFKDFVDEVSALPYSYRVRTFSLTWNNALKPFSWKCRLFDDITQPCLSNVLKRGVMDLKLQINIITYSLPFEVFSCRTVTNLELGGFSITGLPHDASLPDLKTLFLDSVFFDRDIDGHCVFQKLLSVSPKLEELVIDRNKWESWGWSSIVSSPSLKRLTIRREFHFEAEDIGLDCRGLAYDFDSVTLDTPSLTHLEYSDYVPKDYPFVNLDSLVEAKLDLVAEYGSIWLRWHADSFDPRNLINGLKNVEVLDLTFVTLEMFHIFRGATPVFKKLSKVSLGVDNLFCWWAVPELIEKCPNLKTLVIKSRLHGENDSEGHVFHCLRKYTFLDTCPVERLVIRKYFGTENEVEQMKNFLGRLSCLEMVEVHANAPEVGNKRIQVMDDLLMLPRASSKCQIKLKFSPRPY